jgi:hypothetical protein
MTCTNPFLNKCQGEFGPARKPDLIECKTCGYRTAKPAPVTESPAPEQVEEATVPKRKKTTTPNEEN